VLGGGFIAGTIAAPRVESAVGADASQLAAAR